MSAAASLPKLPVPAEDKPLFRSVSSFVRSYMANYDCSHDYDHILRVISNANKILASELASNSIAKYDNTALFLAAFMHDVGDHKYAKEDEDVENQIANVLKERGVSDDLALKIQMIAKHVSWTNETKNPAAVESCLKLHPELAIVQDADRLDAIGAVGVGRCFAFTGAKCHGDRIQVAIDHFDEKLLKLVTKMKTKAGKEMAEERTAVLRGFAEQWERETALSFNFE